MTDSVDAWSWSTATAEIKDDENRPTMLFKCEIFAGRVQDSVVPFSNVTCLLLFSPSWSHQVSLGGKKIKRTDINRLCTCPGRKHFVLRCIRKLSCFKSHWSMWHKMCYRSFLAHCDVYLSSCCGSRHDKQARMYVLAGHLPLKEQQYNLEGLCVNGCATPVWSTSKCGTNRTASNVTSVCSQRDWSTAFATNGEFTNVVLCDIALNWQYFVVLSKSLHAMMCSCLKLIENCL